MKKIEDINDLNEINRKWIFEINDRVKSLRKNNFHLEAFYLFIQVVENRLRKTILVQEEWVKIILLKHNLFFETGHLNRLDKKTLGDMITIFDIYCPDKDLIINIKNLASFRNKIVHHLIDNKLESVNNEAKSFYKKF